MKKIKVMMSTYNGERYIEEQIDSILLQENVEVSLFIRDDGSTDSTIRILESLASKYSNIQVNFGENKGACDSFIELLYTADQTESYDYYAFSDQDDIWQKDKLYRALVYLGDITEPALYYSALLSFQNDSGEKKLISNSREYSFAETFFQSHYPGCTMVLNKKGMELIQNIGKPTCAIMHDLFLAQVFIGTGHRIVYDKESRINYRIHGNNVSVKKDNVFGEFNRYRKILVKQKGLRVSSAKAYKEVIGNRINQSNFDILNTVVEYKKSFWKKCALIRLILNTGHCIKIKFLYSIAVLIGLY